MRLAAPEWLLLLPALGVLAALLHALGLTRPLRALACLGVVLALAQPERATRTGGLDLWVLVDRSDSAEGAVGPRVAEHRAILEESRGSQDSLRWVEFAESPRFVDAPATARFDGPTDGSRLALALRTVASAADPARAHRILVLSDGYATDDVDAARAALTAAEIPVDLRLTAGPAGDDAEVRRLRVPARVELGAPVLLEAEVVATRADEVPYRVRRGEEIIAEGRVKVGPAPVRLRFVDRPPRSGAHRYAVELRPKDDAVPGNDRRARWVEVQGEPQVLVVTSYPEGPLAAALRAAGFSVATVTAGAMHVGRLAGARAVVLEDVPAHRLGRDVLEAMAFYVEQQGGGLWMVGGRASFGSGGYFESPLDPILPVSMELRQTHKKLTAAVAIVLDRSGSMSARVAGGTRSKMDLANDGAARAAQLLGDQDQIAVLAVDSEPHVIVPRTAISSGRKEIVSTIRRIDSRGGGIFVYVGLKAARAQLADATAGQRHVILFSDAADSEAPGEYARLLRSMTEEKMTVSVIGLGRETDADADLLKDVAKRGRGRVFFTEDASELPALFAQETVAVARSVFVTDPAGVAETAGWLEIAPKALDWPAVIDGYNLSYARPEATVAARTRDDEAAPLVAYWRRGRGRVAAVTFPLAGEASASVRGWPGYGDLVASLGRWLAAEATPSGIALLERQRGSTVQLELRHDEAWAERLQGAPPRIATIARGGARPGVQEAVWRRVGPGRWSAEIEAPTQGYLLGVVQAGTANLRFGPLDRGEGLEWRRDPRVRAAVRRLSAATGGAARTRLSDVWRAPRPERFASVGGVALAAALLLFLADAYVTRTGARWPEWARPRWPALRRAPRPRVASTPPVEAAPSVTEPAPDPDEVAAEARRRRLARAKGRR